MEQKYKKQKYKEQNIHIHKFLEIEIKEYENIKKININKYSNIIKLFILHYIQYKKWKNNNYLIINKECCNIIYENWITKINNINPQNFKKYFELFSLYNLTLIYRNFYNNNFTNKNIEFYYNQQIVNNIFIIKLNILENTQKSFNKFIEINYINNKSNFENIKLVKKSNSKNKLWNNYMNKLTENNIILELKEEKEYFDYFYDIELDTIIDEEYNKNYYYY